MRLAPNTCQDPSSFLDLNIHVLWLYMLNEQGLLSLFGKFGVKYSIYLKSFLPLPLFFPLQSAERFGSLTLSHRDIFLLTLLISNSCWESLCEGIVSFCAHSIPAFLLNCQQHQLVPHVVLVCTALGVAKCFLCGQHANWPTDNFLGVSLGGKV